MVITRLDYYLAYDNVIVLTDTLTAQAGVQEFKMGTSFGAIN